MLFFYLFQKITEFLFPPSICKRHQWNFISMRIVSCNHVDLPLDLLVGGNLRSTPSPLDTTIFLCTYGGLFVHTQCHRLSIVFLLIQLYYSFLFHFICRIFTFDPLSASPPPNPSTRKNLPDGFMADSLCNPLFPHILFQGRQGPCGKPHLKFFGFASAAFTIAFLCSGVNFSFFTLIRFLKIPSKSISLKR